MKRNKNRVSLLGVFFLLINPVTVNGQIALHDVTPAMGIMEKDVNATISGSGFGDHTRISMYLDMENQGAIISELRTFRKAKKVLVSGSLALIADGEKGLIVVDISNPYNPIVTGFFSTHIRSFDVADGKAFIAAGEEGIKIVDVSDARRPFLINPGRTLASSLGNAADIALSNGYAYVACMENGLKILDISVPSYPFIHSNQSFFGEATSIALSDSWTFVIELSGEPGIWSLLNMINISNPGHPTLSGTKEICGFELHTTASENYLYITDTIESCFQIHNCGDPQNIYLSNTFPFGTLDIGGCSSGLELGRFFKFHNVLLHGDKAFLSSDLPGLCILNIENKNNPQLLGFVSGKTTYTDVSENFAYLVDGETSFRIVDLARVQEFGIGTIDLPQPPNRIEVENSTAFIAGGASGLLIVDVSNPYAPYIKEQIQTNGFAADVIVSNGLAYVLNPDFGLTIVDVNEPSNPFIAGTHRIETPGALISLSLFDNTLCIGDSAKQIHFIDVVSAHPANVSIIPTDYAPDKLSLFDNRLFIGYKGGYNSSAGVEVWDVSDLRSPTLITRQLEDRTSFESFYFSDNLVYIAATTDIFDTTGTGDFYIWELTDSNSFILSGKANTGFISSDPKRITVENGLAAIMNSSGEFCAIDIDNPKSPLVIGHGHAWISDAGGPFDVSVSENLVYMGGGESYFRISPMPFEVKPISVLNDTQIDTVLPAAQFPGYYNLRAFNGTESDELFDADRFSEKILTTKALIVAGGGPPEAGWNNSIWEETKSCANLAYIALFMQGIPHEDIAYICHEAQIMKIGGEDTNVVDSTNVSGANIYQTLMEYSPGGANEAENLVIYLIDHGGIGTFGLSSTETLTAADLESWLSQINLPGHQIIIYDACYSGSFIPQLATEPIAPGRERIIITSTSSNELTHFQNLGRISFSYKFWGTILGGFNLNEAFSDAEEMVLDLKQHAQIDSDGDGVPNQLNDARIAQNILIGDNRIGPLLFIEKLETDVGLDGQLIVRATVGEPASHIDEVVAIVLPPFYKPKISNEPITDLPEIQLISVGNRVYEGEYTQMNQCGVYQVSVYAASTTEGVKIFSLPRSEEVNFLSPVVKGDLNADCEVDLFDTILALQVLSGQAPMIRSDYSESEVDVGGDLKIGLSEALFGLRKTARIE